MFKFLKLKLLQKRGFTLIELLVVISIIGILSSVVLASLNTARMKARDSRRIQDLKQIKLALELYYDTNGYYPQSGCGWDCNQYRYSYDSTSWNALASDLAPYISTLPIDPINSNCAPWNTKCYSYTYGNVGRNNYKAQYDLTTQLEDPSNPQRCSVKLWNFYFDNGIPWCGGYSNQVYEASGT
jgi:prepilin-type N-terminal cleavage/methylation domain-containing protein